MLKYILEIKYRLFFISFNLVCTLVVSYMYKEVLLFLIIKPYIITDKNLQFLLSYFIFTNITDVFSMYLKLVYFVTVQITVFYLFYHIFIFFSYAMFKKEYNFTLTLLKVIFITFFISILFLNYIILPLSWNFFFSFQNIISSNFIKLYFEPKINEYLNFCLFLYYTFVLYCQFFGIFFFLLSYFTENLVSIKKFRKFYYFTFIVFSTIISPPDVFSQIFISTVLILFYEVLIFFFIIRTLTR